MSWTPSIADDVLEVSVEGATSPGGPWSELTRVEVGSSTATVDVEPGRTWWFAVIAHDKAGNASPRSVTSSVSLTDSSVVTDLTPRSGPSTGESTVTLTGWAFGHLTSVLFDDVPAEIVSRTDRSVVVRPPSRLPGPVEVRASFSSRADQALGTYEYVEAALPAVDDVVAEAGTVELRPADVESIDAYATGDFDLTLVAGSGVVPAGERVYVHPGHADFPTGLAARVVGTRTDEQGLAVLELEQAPLDEVLASREFSTTAVVETPADAAGARDLDLAATTATSGTTQPVLSVRRSWVDCQKLVEAGTANEHYVDMPETEGKVQVNLTMADLTVNMLDRSSEADRRYLATVSGTLQLQIVANFAVKAKCVLKPALLAKVTKRIPVGEMVLSLSPDVSVTFTVEGKAVITKKSTLLVGIEKSGDEPARLVEDFRSAPATIDGSAAVSVRTRVGFDTSLLYKGVLGLYTVAGAYAEVQAVYEADVPQFCVTLKSGLELEVGAKLDYFVGTWKQPVLKPFTHPFVDESRCLPTAGDPDTEIVLDPLVGDNPTASYTYVTPASYDSPFPAGSIVGNGDYYTLTQDITLHTGERYLFSKPLVVPAGVTLTVEPGAHLKMGHCNWTIWWSAISCLVVDGGLVKIGQDGAQRVVISRIGDDSLDGDTDGSPTYPAGWAPIEVGEGGVVVMRSAELRFVGLRSNAGAVTMNDVVFTQGAGFEAAGGVGNIDRVLMDSTAGAFQANHGSGTVSRSRLFQTNVGGSWTVRNSQFAGGQVTVHSPDAVLSGNRFTAIPSGVRALGEGSGALFVDNVTASGEDLVVDVTGTMYRDATWRAGVTYRVTDLLVMQDVTLTLGPGTVVKGSTAYRGGLTFNVRGALRSLGTAERPVVITSLNDDTVGADASTPDPNTNGDQWRGIGLQPFEDRLPSLVLRHTVLRDPAEAVIVHAGVVAELSHVSWETTTSSQGALVSHSDLTSIEDSTFSAAYTTRALSMSSGGAVRRTTFLGTTLEVMSPDAVVEDAVFDEQVSLPVMVTAEAAAGVVDVRYADGSPVPLSVPWWGNTVDTDTSWPGERTYYLTTTLRVLPGATLTVGGGAVVKTDRNVGIDVEGALVASGTAGAPVMFVPTLSAAGGDVLRFSDSMSSDSWRGIAVVGSGTLTVDHASASGAQQFVSASEQTTVLLRHLAHTGAGWQMSVVSYAGGLVIEDSTFTNTISSANLPAVGSYGTASIRGTTFDGTYLAVGSPSLDLHANRFRSLGGASVVNHVTEQVDASGNWWGSAAGPAPDQVTGDVKTAPWCLDEGCQAASS